MFFIVYYLNDARASFKEEQRQHRHNTNNAQKSQIIIEMFYQLNENVDLVQV